MRFHSTPESALKGEITKLAIIECIASVAIYVGIGLYFETFRYLAMAVIVAPLMLLRSGESSYWGLNTFNRFFRRKGHEVSNIDLLRYLFVNPIVGVVIRILAPFYWAFRSPLQTLSGMPQNWLRQSLCTDFFHAPEILPLEAVVGEKFHVPTFAHISHMILKPKHFLGRLIVLILLFPILVIGYLPSLIYRISFKATAVAYLPFIWVAHATLRNPLPTDLRLQRVTAGELEKVRRITSWAIIVTLVAKLGFVLGLVDWSRIEEKFPSKRLVESLVVPTGWPWWQITLGMDAFLTFFLFFFADAALARLKTQQVWSDRKVLGTVSTVSFLRASLGLLTISHFFHIALLAVAPASLHRLLTG